MREQKKRGRKPRGDQPVSKHKVDECAQCRRVMPLPGRGLCGKCYSAALNAEKGKPGRRNQAESPAADDRGGKAVSDVCATTQESGIFWLFAGEAELLATVQELAKKDRRDVRNEVLCIIEEYVGRGEA